MNDIKSLLAKGPNLEATDPRWSRIALMWAIVGDREDIVTRLLEDGADLRSRGTRHGQTALSWASANAHESMVRLLLDKGADSNTEDFSRQRPLDLAGSKHRSRVVQLLESRNAQRRSKSPAPIVETHGKSSRKSLLEGSLVIRKIPQLCGPAGLRSRILESYRDFEIENPGALKTLHVCQFIRAGSEMNACRPQSESYLSCSLDGKSTDSPQIDWIAS